MLQLLSRDEELKSIIRYKQNTVCKPMFYTPDLWIHVQRVTWIAENICKQLGLSPDVTQKVVRRAMFHDDSEIIAGDIATPVKQNWSPQEKKDYEEKCQNAIPILVQNYGVLLGNDYKEILEEMESHQIENLGNEHSLIHAILEYSDKLDAFMETFHELSSGSTGFLSNMKKVFGKDISCWKYIIERVQRRRTKLENILKIKLPQVGLLHLEQLREIFLEGIVTSGRKHTLDSLQQETGIHMYDLWKQLHFENGTPEHISYLYTQNKT